MTKSLQIFYRINLLINYLKFINNQKVYKYEKLKYDLNHNS